MQHRQPPRAWINKLFYFHYDQRRIISSSWHYKRVFWNYERLTCQDHPQKISSLRLYNICCLSTNTRVTENENIYTDNTIIKLHSVSTLKIIWVCSDLNHELLSSLKTVRHENQSLVVFLLKGPILKVEGRKWGAHDFCDHRSDLGSMLGSVKVSQP